MGEVGRLTRGSLTEELTASGLLISSVEIGMHYGVVQCMLYYVCSHDIVKHARRPLGAITVSAYPRRPPNRPKWAYQSRSVENYAGSRSSILLCPLPA